MSPGSVDQGGVIDLFWSLKADLDETFSSEGSFDPQDSEVMSRCRDLVRSHLDRPGLFALGPAENLYVLYAGRFDDRFAERVQTFPWAAFFETFGEVFGIRRDELHRRFDETFIDARTGLTDISNLCTVIMPDRLVVVFAPNHQALEGGVEVAREAGIQHLARMAEKNAQEPLDIVPLLCRLDPDESVMRSNWIQLTAQRFAVLFDDLFPSHDLDLRSYFNSVHIPYRSRFSYGEEVAVLDQSPQRDEGFGSMVAAYETLFAFLQAGRMLDWQRMVVPEQVRDDRSLVLQFDALVRLPAGWRFASEVRQPISPWPDLRDHLSDSETWGGVLDLIDSGIAEAIHDLRGGLFVFGMMPYTAGLLLGRRLDDLARGVPMHIHHLQDGQWQLFSSSERAGARTDAVYQVEDRIVDFEREEGVVLALEGMRSIRWETLEGLASGVGACRIVRLSQRDKESLKPPAQTAQAVREVRQALAGLQQEMPQSTIHIVTTAPLALLIEVGRLLSPTVFHSVVVHEHVSKTASYLRTVDLIASSVSRRGRRSVS